MAGLINRFGVRLIRTVTVREIENWLHGLFLGPQSFVNYRAVVHALFEHCVKRRLAESNPIAAIDKVKLVNKAPEILTPEQLSRLLSAAPFDLLPLLAIQAFAGLRTEETMRLDWSEVDQVRGHITVSAKKAKTARRRLIPVASNLAQYLRPYAGMSGPVWPQGGRVYHKAIKRLRSDIGITYWPQNGRQQMGPHRWDSVTPEGAKEGPQLELPINSVRGCSRSLLCQAFCCAPAGANGGGS